VSVKVWGVIVGGCLVAAVPASAQSSSQPRAASAEARAEAAARQQRYEISTLERVFEGAVEHAVTVTRDRLQAVAQMPTELVFSDNAHSRGFRLEGYGVFFDVIVPSFETTLWTLRTMDQNDLGLDSAMKELQQIVKGNINAEQALRRVELQVSPVSMARPVSSAVAASRTATGSTAAATDDPTARAATDPILQDPNEAYRSEVIAALKEAMLNHSSSLGIQANEWLTIAARGNDDRPRLAPADTSARTRLLRLKGADLLAFLAQNITKDEALERIEVRVY
jgi:hypothetical protein